MKFQRSLILIVLLGILIMTVKAQESNTAQLNDPGPVWQGLTDTTALNKRMNEHIYRAGLKINRLKKYLKGQRMIEPIENKALEYLYAEQELENARLLARAG